MTIDKLEAGLGHPVEKIAASVTIDTSSDPVLVADGVPFSVSITADPGELITDTTSTPLVQYTGDWTLSFDTGEVFHSTTLGPIQATLSGPGNHRATASAASSGGAIVSDAVQFVAELPTFTITAAPGGTFEIPESGMSTPVAVTVPNSTRWPELDVFVQDGPGASLQKLNSGGESPDVRSGVVQLSGTPVGARSLLVLAQARVGSVTPSTTQRITFTATDGTPPAIRVTAPPNGGAVVADASRPVTLTGTCTDPQSGVASATIGVALSPAGPFTAASTAGGPNIVTWSAAIAPPGLGSFSLYIKAGDNAANSTILEWPLEAITGYVPTSLDARVSDSEYLAALTAFARSAVITPTGAARTADLVDVLSQPIDQLSQPDPTLPSAAAGHAPVNELRVPVELLRTELASQTPLPADPSTGQRAYLQAAYEALLSASGTSYTELRLARGADQPLREALADRLGIQLTGPGGAGTRPDQLDLLTLSGPDLTEAALETRFGLPQTTPGLSPLRPFQPSSLLTWQLTAQTARWATEDFSPTSQLGGAPVIDPDVITAADVLPSAPQTLTELLAQRSSQLDGHAATVTAAIAASSDPGKLAAAIAASLPSTTLDNLLEWQAREKAGGDATTAIAGVGLDRVGYQWLLRMANLVQAGQPIADDEWKDTVDVLTGAYRRRQYPTWKSVEASGVVLGPDSFAAAPTGPPVTPLRVSPAARQTWLRVLGMRTLQRQSLTDAAAGIQTFAEQQALPVLRDALLAALTSGVGMATADALARHYQVDFLASGSLSTTRIAQATASVQNLLQAIRSGDTLGTPMSTWKLKDSDPAVFDAAWTWFGGIGTWRQATTSFLFPESLLDPALTSNPSAPFQKFRDSLATVAGNDPATAVAAAAATYITDQKGAPSFSYLSGRDPAHQAAMDTLSGNPGLPADLSREAFWAVPLLASRTLLTAGAFQAALDWLWVVYPYTDPSALSCYHEINIEASTPLTGPDLSFPDGWTANLNPFDLVAGRPAPYLRNTLLQVASALTRYADSEFGTDDDASVEHALQLYQKAQAVLAHPVLKPVPPVSPGEPTLAIPQLTTLSIQAATQLQKIRQGRNIAGLPRVAAASEGTGSPVRQPTPYHFKLLVARAQQMTQQAIQFEAEYLSLLEKFDSKTMTLKEAEFAASLTDLQSQAQQDRVQQANDSAAAAAAQVEKANTMVGTYSAALSTPNPYEKDLLNDYEWMSGLQDVISVAQGAIDIASAASKAASVLSFITTFGASVVGGGLEITGIAARTAAQVALNGMQLTSQADALRASQEERRRQLATQLASAHQDVQIAHAQQTVSQDQVTIAQAEQKVVDAQRDHAKATLALLQNQFTNPDLYQWMSDTLGRIYEYFLQQATATARLAQEQLAFERVEQPRDLVGTDYWKNQYSTSQGGSTDARGMTGAERLAEDISRLEQYAFSSDMRRLNITQSFSLAQLLPVDFLGFRQTGQLAFTTPAMWFDQDFPGHYQRLIRQVRMNVVALVPPSRGIRGTLSSTGISRVTTLGAFGSYTSVTVRRDPTTIVATSPLNASGVFALDIQPDLLLPFEGSGVETTWLLSLPQAANPFDFANVADVILTIDYTAISDPDYRTQIIQSLNHDLTRSSDRVLSLSRDFPDQWYALWNPQPGTPRAATFTVGPADFPVGFTDVTIAQLAVLVKTDGTQDGAVQVPITLTRTGADDTPVGGVAATDTTAMASTRRSALQWHPLIGASPNGTWRIAFDTTADPLFAGPLVDVLVMITWQAQSPAWPL